MTLNKEFEEFNTEESEYEFLFIAPKLYKWEEHIEVMALGMEDEKYNRGWRVAKPVGEHTTGFLLVYDDIEEYYQCHDETPFVIARRKKDGNNQGQQEQGSD